MGQFIARISATNDSDVITTPNGGGWLDFVYIAFVSTADVGNRQLELRVLDAAGTVLYSAAAGAVQAASLTRKYLFQPGVSREAAFVGGGITVPMPRMYVPDGGGVQVVDTAAIAAAADDWTATYGWSS